MLVQKITFDLLQSKLDDIRIVQGDSGREILFEGKDLEGPVSYEDYTFTFNLIKPDHTFVIQTLTAGLLTISEQMWIISGTSYYNVRITDLDDNIIYSGQGAFIVDDALITEDDIESVAEVNGYIFPDDFATTDKISEIVEDLGFAKIADNHQNLTETWSSEKIAQYASVMAEGLIADDQIALDHTWSSSKISDELAEKAIIDDDTTSSLYTWSSAKINDVAGKHIYSSIERVVGTWIDGREIYEKTVTLSSSIAISWNVGFDVSSYLPVNTDIIIYSIGYNQQYKVSLPFSIFFETGTWKAYAYNHVTFNKMTVQYVKNV